MLRKLHSIHSQLCRWHQFCTFSPHFHIHHYSPLYTRNQGQCSTQIQHSYWYKSWNQPQGIYTRSQGWNRKKLFNLLINAELYGFVLAPRLKKGYHHIWETNIVLGATAQFVCLSYEQLYPLTLPINIQLVVSFLCVMFTKKARQQLSLSVHKGTELIQQLVIFKIIRYSFHT
jgi:hypothetical protein